MMRIIAWIFRQFGAMILWILRGIGGLLRDIVLDVLRAAGQAMRRFVRWLAPWVIGGGIIMWLIKNQPDTLVSLLGIGACFFALWVMVRGILPKKKKK